MPETFAITTTITTLPLDNQRRGSVDFTVTNNSGRALRGRGRVVPGSPVAAPWLTLDGPDERPFSATGSEQYTVRIAVPPTAPQGDYTFRLDVVGVDNPDEELSEGPPVGFTVPAPIKREDRLPWWWWIPVAAGGVLLLIVGVIIFLVVSDNNRKSAEAAHFDGTWTIASGSLTLSHDVDKVSGPYNDLLDALTGSLQGTVVSPTLSGQIALPGRTPAPFTLTISQSDTLLLGTHPLCGAKAGTPFPDGCSFAGAWTTLINNSTTCGADLTLTDQHLTGALRGGICAVVTLQGNISYPGSSRISLIGTVTSGGTTLPLTFLLTADGTQFQGSYTSGGSTFPWCGSRSGHPLPTPCMP